MMGDDYKVHLLDTEYTTTFINVTSHDVIYIFLLTPNHLLYNVDLHVQHILWVIQT